MIIISRNWVACRPENTTLIVYSSFNSRNWGCLPARKYVIVTREELLPGRNSSILRTRTSFLAGFPSLPPGRKLALILNLLLFLLGNNTASLIVTVFSLSLSEEEEKEAVLRRRRRALPGARKLAQNSFLFHIYIFHALDLPHTRM